MVLSVASLCFFSASSHAQLRVEIQGVGQVQRPIMVAPFQTKEQNATVIDAVVMADLERSGLFRRVEPLSHLRLNEASLPDFETFRPSGADFLVTGSLNKVREGYFEIRYRLWDLVQKQDLGGFSFPVGEASLRMGAHQVADAIYEKITAEKGVFTTRIAYITKNNKQYHLWVADSDGQAASPALSSPQPIISPRWSPSGDYLAYVSFESGKPTVFVHQVQSGKRTLIANFKGSNSAPAWSPNGKQLVVALTLSGHTQLYVLDLSSGKPRRLSDSTSIDTDPFWSPDGQFIYFVSDRGGSPQIYRIKAAGGRAERVTLNGQYNTSPALSPDGKFMAYISKEGDQFRLTLMELASQQTKYLTDTAHDERPSFAANGRMIIYATRVAGKEALMVTTVNGQVRTRLIGESGDIREPSWGPFR